MTKEPLSWDEYFMGVALLAAHRSKDPNTRVGACIVNQDKKIVGVGYNGFPRGCSDESLPWKREGTFLNTKYPYVCHAELNAILNNLVGIYNLKDCTLYVSLFPCHECAKIILQAGITTVVYMEDKYADTDSAKAARKMLSLANVRTWQFKSNKQVVLSFSPEK